MPINLTQLETSLHEKSIILYHFLQQGLPLFECFVRQGHRHYEFGKDAFGKASKGLLCYLCCLLKVVLYSQLNMSKYFKRFVKVFLHSNYLLKELFSCCVARIVIFDKCQTVLYSIIIGKAHAELDESVFLCGSVGGAEIAESQEVQWRDDLFADVVLDPALCIAAVSLQFPSAAQAHKFAILIVVFEEEMLENGEGAWDFLLTEEVSGLGKHEVIEHSNMTLFFLQFLVPSTVVVLIRVGLQMGFEGFIFLLFPNLSLQLIFFVQFNDFIKTTDLKDFIGFDFGVAERAFKVFPLCVNALVDAGLTADMLAETEHHWCVLSQVIALLAEPTGFIEYIQQLFDCFFLHLD